MYDQEKLERIREELLALPCDANPCGSGYANGIAVIRHEPEPYRPEFQFQIVAMWFRGTVDTIAEYVYDLGG